MGSYKDDALAQMYFNNIQKYCANHNCDKQCVFYDILANKCLINYPFGDEQMKLPKINDNLKRIQNGG